MKEARIAASRRNLSAIYGDSEVESIFEIQANLMTDASGKTLGEVVKGKKAYLVVNVASNDLLFTDKSYRQLSKLQSDLGPQGL